MSKSVKGSYINLTDDAATIQQKIRSIPTATQAGGEMSPGLESLFTLAELFLTPNQHQQYLAEFKAGTLRFVDIKDTVAEAISQELKPLQAKRQELANQPEYIDQVMAEGAQKAGAIATKVVQEVKRKMGLA